MTRVSIDSPVGTRVRYIGPSMHDLHTGDLGTVAGVNSWSNVAITMDNARGRGLRTVQGVECHWTTSGSDFDVVEGPTEPAVGVRVRIKTDEAYGATVNAGDEGAIVYVSERYPEEFYVLMDNYRGSQPREWNASNGGDWVFRIEDVDLLDATSVAPEPEAETLESFRIKFLEGAVARGIANGERHSAQVTEALDNFARLEFLEPSTTLEAFQARVVALAMESKGRYSWCGEPEAYLTSIGLGHLLPRRMVVEVITEVVVMATPGMSDRDIRTAARAQAATLDDGGSFWTNDPRLVP